MMFALVSIIYPRITMVDQYSDIRELLQKPSMSIISELRKWTYHDCALSTHSQLHNLRHIFVVKRALLDEWLVPLKPSAMTLYVDKSPTIFNSNRPL